MSMKKKSSRNVRICLPQTSAQHILFLTYMWISVCNCKMIEGVDFSVEWMSNVSLFVQFSLNYKGILRGGKWKCFKRVWKWLGVVQTLCTWCFLSLSLVASLLMRAHFNSFGSDSLNYLEVFPTIRKSQSTIFWPEKSSLGGPCTTGQNHFEMDRNAFLLRAGWHPSESVACAGPSPY